MVQTSLLYMVTYVKRKEKCVKTLSGRALKYVFYIMEHSCTTKKSYLL